MAQNKTVKWVKNNPLMVIGLGAGLAYIASRFQGLNQDDPNPILSPPLTKKQKAWEDKFAKFDGLGKAGMLGDENDDMFRKTGYTGKHAFGTPEPIHPMPSGPKISYRLEDHEQPMMLDPIYERAKRPRDASQFQPASVRNMNLETTVSGGFESTVFAGIDQTNTF